MQINKFKKIGKNKYKIFFDNTNLVLFEDIILKYELLLKKDLDSDLIDKIINENSYYEAYDTILSYIETKMRNRKEIINYLERKDYNESIINYGLDKLDSMNLLNDVKYIEAYVNDKVNMSLDGPFKIKNYLLELDFNESDIDNYLDSFDSDIWYEKIDKIIKKKLSLMKNKSYYMFFNKIKNDLYNMGYDKEMIDYKLSSVEYESDALEKDFLKVQKKYKNNKNKIINSLLRKGYSYEEINSKFDK